MGPAPAFSINADTEELTLLAQLLSSEKDRLMVEIRHTDHRNFRDGLRRRLELVEHLLERCPAAHRLMDCITALKTRRSIRAYTDAPVSPEVLADLVDCGRLAATAINIQPWEFVVVTEKSGLRAIADATDYGKFIAHAAACIVVLCRDTKYYLEDGANASQNILTAAHAHGLGGCWVAGDKKPYADAIRRLVGAPAEMRLVSLLAVGYPAESGEKSKRPVEEVLHWEKY